MAEIAGHLGIYGRNVIGTRQIHAGTGHVNLHGAMYSSDTNVHPAFGMRYKVERNRNVVQSVVAQTWGLHSYKGPNGADVFGEVQEKLNDPLHRDPAYILQRAREQSSIAGRSRGNIRPAAPQQVTWKNPYWVLQRTRGARGTTIGPYGTTAQKLTQQSVLSRISGFLSGTGG